jgi:aryl-alcohol dehydrogenase-like predicted oxidoreductase
LGVEYLDICLCHDIEFVDLGQIVEVTLPALREVQRQGKVRYVGVSGYPLKMFRYIIERTEIDVCLSYNHYTLQNTMLAELVPDLQCRGIGIMNAAPFSARLLTHAPLPPWHKATAQVRSVAKQAADHCRNAGIDIAQLALQFSIRHPDLTTCIAGSASPLRIAQWAEWIERPLDETLLAEVLEILKPIHNWFYIEGRPENNDEPKAGKRGHV